VILRSRASIRPWLVAVSPFEPGSVKLNLVVLSAYLILV